MTNIDARPGLRGAARGAAGRRASDSPLELDRAIHEPLRLGMVSALAVNVAMTFVQLKAALGATDGNLSVHARRLETAGYVTSTKSFEGRVPRTEYRLTHAGRKALEAYLDRMEAIIRTTRSAAPRPATG